LVDDSVPRRPARPNRYLSDSGETSPSRAERPAAFAGKLAGNGEVIFSARSGDEINLWRIRLPRGGFGKTGTYHSWSRP
jgi:hypothetical protein